MRLGNEIEPQPRRQDRDAQGFGDLQENFLRARRPDAIAGQEDGSLGRVEQLDKLGDFLT